MLWMWVVMCSIQLCQVLVYELYLIFFFKQKTAYEMRISDWSSDVCSSDLPAFDKAALMMEIDTRRIPVTTDYLADVGAMAKAVDDHTIKIGRASCRERVCQYV